MARIPQHFIQDLISRIDIVEIVQQRVNIIKRGRNYTACCPFHQEKTPSFTVSPDKQFYYCFGCGAHGNAIGFLMAFDRMEFMDAVHHLAAQMGIEVPQEETGKPSSAQIDTKPLYESLEKATAYYELQLKQTPRAIEYLKARQVTGKTAKLFRLGYAPATWQALEKAFETEPATVKALEINGLLLLKKSDQHFDRFRDRIMFPIRDVKGQVVGFGGRTLDKTDSVKYLNSPETPLFHKKSELYGLFEARQRCARLERLLVVEGYMDVIALAEHDIPYAVASLGTAIGAKHLQKCLRYTSTLIFCFDGDEAGNQAAWRALTHALTLLHDGIQMHFMFLPTGEDPDSFVNKMKKTGFEKAMNQAVRLSDYFFNTLQERIPLSSLDAKARFSKEALNYLQAVPDGVFLQLMKQRLSEWVGIGIEGSAPRPRLPPSPIPSSSAPLAAPLKLMLALLLQTPTLMNADSWSLVEQLELPGKEWLARVMHHLAQNPTLSIGELLSHLEEDKLRALVAELAVWELHMAPPELPEEFQQTLERVAALNAQVKAEKLIEKSKLSSLTLEEKTQLKRLLFAGKMTD